MGRRALPFGMADPTRVARHYIYVTNPIPFHRNFRKSRKKAVLFHWVSHKSIPFAAIRRRTPGKLDTSRNTTVTLTWRFIFGRQLLPGSGV